jgi:hypothetical protein
MAIKEINQVTIPGFGAYALYSFSYSPGFSEGYGSIEAEFLNKTGVYNTATLDSDLNNNVFFQVALKTGDGAVNSLGQFTLAKYEVAASGQYKILKIKLVDRSVELDRYLVALRGQVGYDSVAMSKMSAREKERIVGEMSSSGRIIWVGESDTSCKESVLDELHQDPCDPCDAAINENIVNKIDCEEYYLRRKRIYQYSFSELLSALSSKNIGVSFYSAGAFDSHKFDYVGSIREVLNNICSELGLTFFYNPTLSRIELVDVRAGININIKHIEDVSYKCKILEKSFMKSKEGSKDVLGVSSFQREAEEKKYGCALDSCKKLKMKPFTLEDLFGRDDGGAVSAAHISEDEILGSQPSAVRKLEALSMLTGRVGREFRDIFLWHEGYKFTTAQELQDIGLNKKLTALNGMTIKRVFWSGSTDSKDKYIYRLLTRSTTAKNFESIKDRVSTKKTYYFLAEIDEAQDAKVHNVEASLCNNFFGQYWIRRFKQHWTGLSYSTLSPDGSVTYYDFRSPINLPFSDIVLEATGSLSNSPLLQRDDDGFGDSIAEGDTPGTLVARDTFFLMSRPAAFAPAALAEDTQKAIQKNIEKFGFKEISIASDFNNLLKTVDGVTEYDPAKHRIYQINELGGDDDTVKVTYTNDEHPEEKENVVIRVNACNKYTSYGLADADTIKFKYQFKDVTFAIMMPVQSYAIGSEDQPHDGYTILVERSGNDSTTLIPKTEVFDSGVIPAVSSSSLGIEFNSYNATTNDLELLAKSADKSFCDLSLTAVQDLLDDLTGLLNYSVGNTEEKSFKIEGVTYDFYTVLDGLKSFSMSIGGGGLTTDISFSNSFPFRLTPEQFLKKLKYLHLKQIQSAFAQGKLPENKDSDLKSFEN